MSDPADSLIPALLRRMDGKLDRVTDDVQDLKHRMTSVERQLGDMRVGMAGLCGRLDRLETRFDGIERRLDIVAA